jgi:hypothetical protein
MTLVDGGATSKNTYDAENQRVRIDNAGKPSTEFIFNPFGQRASIWDATDHWQSQGQTYWGRFRTCQSTEEPQGSTGNEGAP